jgi:malate dehydrogenase (oxaloacetate-decarboxylating)(NADP+)
VIASRADLAEHKRAFAQERAPAAGLREAIESFRPTALVGATGKAGLFTRPVLEAMARVNERPVILALSNPTSKAECTAEQAYSWTEGRAVFAAGSPFAPVTLAGRVHVPGQANNSYIFPGVGLGLLFSGAKRVTDEMFLAAARALAGQVSETDLAQGRIYPAPVHMREVAAAVAAAVAETEAASIARLMYQPRYA